MLMFQKTFYPQGTNLYGGDVKDANNTSENDDGDNNKENNCKVIL